jgi:hypothetical protein
MDNKTKARKLKEKGDHQDMIVYDSFEKKNVLEQKINSKLPPNESLIHTLNMMDFMAALKKKDSHSHDEKIDWIVLQLATK